MVRARGDDELVVEASVLQFGHHLRLPFVGVFSYGEEDLTKEGSMKQKKTQIERVILTVSIPYFQPCLWYSQRRFCQN
jgi:hypothetical protein